MLLPQIEFHFLKNNFVLLLWWPTSKFLKSSMQKQKVSASMVVPSARRQSAYLAPCFHLLSIAHAIGDEMIKRPQTLCTQYLRNDNLIITLRRSISFWTSFTFSNLPSLSLLPPVSYLLRSLTLTAFNLFSLSLS